MASKEAIEQIKSDEGFSKVAEFIKLQGKSGGQEKFRTIGHGFSLKDIEKARETMLLIGIHPNDIDGLLDGTTEISKPIADALFQVSLQQAELDASNTYSNWSTLPRDIQDVLVNMSYQLGKTNLGKFVKMKAAIEEENWPEMKKEMLDSKWARDDSTSRANRLAKVVKQVEFTPIPAPISQSNLPRVNIQARYDAERLDQEAEELVSHVPDDALATELADAGWAWQQANPETEEEQEQVVEAKPKLAKLEQGLFEDEAGKKFFVDADNRLLELGEDNQPRAVIDPSKFDLSKVSREPEQINPEEEIF